MGVQRALVPVSLRAQARADLRTRIVVGEFAPGSVQSIQTVAAELGVSVTPVREAVMDLASAGMLEIVRNRGFRVPVLSEHDLDEILAIRTMLEAPAIGEVAANPPIDALGPARVSAEQCLTGARDGDIYRFLTHDREFHLGLLATIGNVRLVDTVGALRDQARLYGLQGLADQGRLTDSAQEHFALLDAVEAGDVNRARELMTRHLGHSRGIWAGRAEADEPAAPL